MDRVRSDHHPRDSKIGQYGSSIVAEHDIGRFYIPVNHALCMGVAERFGDGSDDVDRGIEG